eukprot:GSChrysophyteH1.ASY1.ANO1.790.1 assembled CDS
MERVISESAYFYLLREVLMYEPPGAQIDDKESIQRNSQRLETMGYDVGFRIVDRMTEKLKFLGFDDLDCVKFICREFWESLFGKKIDKLQTNRKGVFVLLDLQFKWIEKYTQGMDAQNMDDSSKQIIDSLLKFPCGVIRGALTNLGMNVNVTCDFAALPSVTFSVRRKVNDSHS